MPTIVRHARDLQGLLTLDDRRLVSELETRYEAVMRQFPVLPDSEEARNLVTQNFDEMGRIMREALENQKRIQVYSFSTPSLVHGEASRLIAKLRDVRTQRSEFTYYIQRAYEMLFHLGFTREAPPRKNHFLVKTPVTAPVQNWAVHKIPDMDKLLSNTVMCVLLRGALLPSMILSKEIQENSSLGYVTPFALFRIKRNEEKSEADMAYVLDLDKSFFRLEELEGRDLLFADPMNATGGSLVTVVDFLRAKNIRPLTIKTFNVISSLKGALQTIRAIPEATVYTLWMDPFLNSAAYILPGLGDAGDRLNGRDKEDTPRNIVQLLADYGSFMTDLYRSQVARIERTVLG